MRHAAEPWSKANHELFPAAVRRVRVPALPLIGRQLSRRKHFSNGLWDCFVTGVMPFAVSRDDA